jgi:hypothetical protein
MTSEALVAHKSPVSETTTASEDGLGVRHPELDQTLVVNKDVSLTLSEDSLVVSGTYFVSLSWLWLKSE